MSKWIAAVAFLCAGWVAGCGGDDGGSGVSGSKTVASLSDSEITAVCEYVVEADGPARTVDCGGGLTVTVGADTAAQCTADFRLIPDGCTATVSNAEDCAEAIAAQSDQALCSSFPTPCVVLFSAACGGLD